MTTNQTVERPSELLGVKEVAELLACSPRHIYRMTDRGHLPKPVRLGALVRWRRCEILDWVAQGCPRVRTARGGQRV